MYSSLRFMFLSAVITILLVGCSSGGLNPITPSDVQVDPSSENIPQLANSGDALNSERDFSARTIELATIDDTFHSLGTMGIYELNLDGKTMAYELIPARRSTIGESYIVSGAGFFTVQPCPDCLKVESVELTPDNLIQLNFSISHPFQKGNPSLPPTARNRLDLDVFDLALVVVPSEAEVQQYPLTGASAYAKLCAKADGFTRELYGFTMKREACPYFLVIDNSDTTTLDYNKFEMGTKGARFSAYFAGDGNFNLYLTMGYGASAKKFTRFNPQYYNPEFNRKAAWKVEVIPPEGGNAPARGNTWDDFDLTTAHPVTVKVYDWQQIATVAAVYPDINHRDQILKASGVSNVSVEIPGMTNSLNSSTTADSGDGSPSNPLIYTIPIVNANGLPPGEYLGLVKVTDERIPASPANPGQTDALVHSSDGIYLDWFSMPEFATYQVFKAAVVRGENITITNPNGGETWVFGNPATITWTWAGTTSNVNINLSMDSGATYPISIASNVVNNGSYSFGPSGVGEWITNKARIRVTSSTDSSITDQSNADFAIVCPGLLPPANVNATDGNFHDRVTVSWDTATGATGYNIFRDNVLQQSNYTTLTWDDMSATPGVVYNYQLQSVKGGCTSEKSANEPGNACVLPDVPTNVAASDGEHSDRIHVTWNSANLATSYNVFRNGTLRISNVTATNWDDTAVIQGTIYQYQVQSVNDCGTSDLSTADQGNACVLPAVPTGLSASDGIYYDHVALSWNAAALATTYNIYRNSSLYQSNVSGTTWNDTAVTPGTSYTYQVQSQNTCGTSALSTSDQGYACELPATPTGLAASDGTYTDHIRLTWNAAARASTYNIYRNTTLQQTGVTGTTWDDYSASGGRIYTYEVEAVNSCGVSTSKSTADTGWYRGCTTDSNDPCSNATKMGLEDTVTGCVDMIDEDWFYFYVSPNGFTSASTIGITVSSNVDVSVYGIDPGNSCPGSLITSWTNVGSQTLNLPSSNSSSRVYIKLKGTSGQSNYTMTTDFTPALTNIPVEIYVATDNGTPTGVWPTDGSNTQLTIAILQQMMTWANNFWNPYGYNLVWDNTATIMSSQYYVLNTWTEESQMHATYNSGTSKLCMYFVDQLCPGYSTAYCWVFDPQSDHNVNNVYSVYSPNIWGWEDVIAHEQGHGIAYFNDVYLYGGSGCPCGDHVCFENYYGYAPYLYDNTVSCYNGNLMWYYVSGWHWNQFNLTAGQYNWVHEFHYNNTTNFPWY